MSYHQLSSFESGRVEELTSFGLSNRMTAKRLGRHRSTIDRKLRRNKTKAGYDSEFAQMPYHQQRKKSKSKGKRSDELTAIIEEKLLATWSPEQIANTIMRRKISFKTIYNSIYMGSLHGMNTRVLRHKGKRRKADKRSAFSMGMSISERPKEVAHRLVFGHWELDTMVSSRGENTTIKTSRRTTVGMVIQRKPCKEIPGSLR
jgi:transposase, IS30 family